MDGLSALGTGLGKLEAQRKMIIDANKVKCETTTPKMNQKADKVFSHISPNIL
jgi:hypothetical protein